MLHQAKDPLNPKPRPAGFGGEAKGGGPAEGPRQVEGGSWSAGFARGNTARGAGAPGERRRSPARDAQGRRELAQRLEHAAQTVGTDAPRGSERGKRPRPRGMGSGREAPNPKPETRNPKPWGQAEKPEALKPKPETRNPKLETQTLNPKPETRNPKP